MELTAQRVNELFLDCLFKDGEDHTNHIAVEGLTENFGLHPQRLESHRQEIKELLDELPEQFKEGWSFLQACVDKHGNQWAEHPTMQELFVMGIGLKLAEYCAPRDMWRILPGGMPYIKVLG